MENKQKIRSHLTKEQRLPRCFKEVEKVLRSVKSCKQNYKTILANSRLRGHIHKKVYSMTVNVLKYYSYIQKVIDEIHLLEKEKYLKREMASILVYELIFGNGYLPGESKVVKTLQLYENDIFHAHEVLQNKVDDNLIMEINIPRYVRVHTLVTTVPYVIKDLTSYGFHQVIYDNDLPEEKYLELVKNLNKGSFLIDFHFKDVLVFEHHENLISLDLYKNGHIFLQDKSSYIPVHVLNPQPACAVLDACAAPGMKTVHIAAKMKNKGILIACERDKSRFECLRKMLDCGSVKICKTLCKDFKLLDPSDQAYSTIEYILIDPSCSGSGMVNRMDEVTDTENSKNTERLSKLAGFQIILLKHSLKFPAVKRVVYSTCSIHEEENEYVVHEALKAFSGTFKLLPAMPEWSHRGSEKFEFGKLCLRTDPKIHLTNGFFVAVFERINYDEYLGECHQNPEDCDFSFKKGKKKSMKQEKNYEKVTEDYTNINLKQELDISHPLELHQINDGVKNNNSNSESFVQNMHYEQEQNYVYAHKTKKHKKEKREKSNEYKRNENSESSVQNMDYEQKQDDGYAHLTKKQIKIKNSNECSSNKNPESFVQNMDYEQKQNDIYVHKTKKHKKEKREKMNEYNSNTNSESIVQNKDYDQEQNDIYAHQTKKHKKKKREKSDDQILKSSNILFSENNDNLSIQTGKDKSKYNKHQTEGSPIKNIESLEEFTDKKSHKKKKKKKEYNETEMPDSYELNEKQPKVFSKLKDNSGAIFTKEDASVQDNYSMNICEDSEKLISMTSSCKKKKKKKHSNIDPILSPMKK